jgi:hypothetical protein
VGRLNPVVGKNVEWNLIGSIKDKGWYGGYETFVPAYTPPDMPKRKIQTSEWGCFC